MLSKKEIQYMNNAKIYKLVCNITGDTYYGSTIKSLKHRLSEHKSNYKRYLNGKYRYTTSFKIIENGDYRIKLVEDYRCMNRKQLESIERVYIEGYPCINKCVVGRTRKEINKAYRENNKDKIKEYGKEYYENNKDYYKEYYQDNKNKITEFKNEKFECECGGKYTYSNKLQHFKTNKHIKYYKNKIY